MKLLGGISPATRISVALACATVTVLLTATAVGLLPNNLGSMADARLRLSEALAMQVSAAARHADPAALPILVDAMRQNYPQLLSVGLRADGELIFATEGHRTFWIEDHKNLPGMAYIDLPLFESNEAWANVEFCYSPISRDAVRQTTMRLTIFMGLLGFVLYRLYLHQILKYLDPSSVIPDRVKAMLDTMAEGVLVLDHRQRIVLANEAFEESTGLTLVDLQGRKASEVQWNGGDHDAAEPSLSWAAAATEGSVTKGIEFKLDRDDGSKTFMVNATPILGGDGSCRGAMVTFDDMTAIEEKNAKLEQMVRELDAVRQHVEKQNEDLQLLATRDALTQCLNRRALYEQLEKAWSAVHRYGHTLACVMLDIDHFKSVNDEHGHAMGDQVLQRVAHVLNSSTRESDIVGRYGGEEFCIVMPHVGIEQAAVAAEKLRQGIAALELPGLTVTASFGVSSVELDADDPPELVDQADRALYAAKNTGRNRVARWDRMPDLPELESAEEKDRRVPKEDHVHIPFRAVLGLVSALEQRHEDTAHHSRRVADLCMMMADGLMSAGEAVVLEVAAMLHDIGKIGVPDAVLLKPGPLTDEEWEIMEKHDRVGIEIINSAFKSAELTNIVVNHHARYAGSDDPAMPKGQEIPLRARIVAIADAYDAMVSDRVYRKGMSQEAAFAELRRCAGTQFDPELVDRFIDRLVGRAVSAASAASEELTDGVLRLGLDTERLAATLDAGDVKTLATIAERIERTATRRAWTEIAELARDLAEAANSADDLEQILKGTRDLLTICHATQTEALAAARTAADRDAG